MDKYTEELTAPKQAHESFQKLWRIAKTVLEGGKAMTLTLSHQERTTDQNAAQWPILRAFSEQLKWPVNGQLTMLSEEEWKDILTAAFLRESVRIAAGLEGGVVMLGQKTSRMPKDLFSEWIDFLRATAIQRNVDIGDTTWEQ